MQNSCMIQCSKIGKLVESSHRIALIDCLTLPTVNLDYLMCVFLFAVDGQVCGQEDHQGLLRILNVTLHAHILRRHHGHRHGATRCRCVHLSSSVVTAVVAGGWQCDERCDEMGSVREWRKCALTVDYDHRCC